MLTIVILTFCHEY